MKIWCRSASHVWSKFYIFRNAPKYICTCGLGCMTYFWDLHVFVVVTWDASCVLVTRDAWCSWDLHAFVLVTWDGWCTFEISMSLFLILGMHGVLEICMPLYLWLGMDDVLLRSACPCTSDLGCMMYLRFAYTYDSMRLFVICSTLVFKFAIDGMFQKGSCWTPATKYSTTFVSTTIMNTKAWSIQVLKYKVSSTQGWKYITTLVSTASMYTKAWYIQVLKSTKFQVYKDGNTIQFLFQQELCTPKPDVYKLSCTSFQVNKDGSTQNLRLGCIPVSCQCFLWSLICTCVLLIWQGNILDLCMYL